MAIKSIDNRPSCGYWDIRACRPTLNPSMTEMTAMAPPMVKHLKRTNHEVRDTEAGKEGVEIAVERTVIPVRVARQISANQAPMRSKIMTKAEKGEQSFRTSLGKTIYLSGFNSQGFQASTLIRHHHVPYFSGRQPCLSGQGNELAVNRGPSSLTMNCSRRRNPI